MREPVIKLARGFLCICWISVSTEYCVFFGIRDAARSVSIRHTGKRLVHLARCQRRIGHRAEATRFVDIDFPTVLLCGRHADEQHQGKPFHGQFLTHDVPGLEYRLRYVGTDVWGRMCCILQYVESRQECFRIGDDVWDLRIPTSVKKQAPSWPSEIFLQQEQQVCRFLQEQVD